MSITVIIPRNSSVRKYVRDRYNELWNAWKRANFQGVAIGNNQRGRIQYRKRAVISFRNDGFFLLSNEIEGIPID